MFERARRQPPRVDITALIDVIFLLVIFFMLTTQYMRERSMNLSVNTRGFAAGVYSGKEVQVIIREIGYYEIAEIKYKEIELKKALGKLIENPSQPVIIKVMADIPVQQTITALDNLRLSGAENIKLERIVK